ncbi:hypothetical protein COU00_02770 [Candidatus Falkowbacteria bacterium CG10_big_fil_rev_8_21_14_0_10_43_11]|uniref:Uncharacterized protein n=1 Tax=Candidatus Falkowbacteria bacterium CG10_big_fil_rev_8_21_14_0_10_43_11 TaxID=1974568 RepID=A0A2M6WLN3_9BACT|nr:MAG: hypothetical protein COU00_02770 [Candidatus Falkowbacteria bacterium CG10_big_fil_rev_8_21_14_0_10_43_11]
MQNQLDRIINLVKKTGDRLVVLDRDNPRQSYVVMDINDYEMLVDKGECHWDGDGESDDFYKEPWDESDEEDEDWDFKPENYLSDDLKEDNNEYDFNEPPIVDLDGDDYGDDGKEDFTPIDEIFAEKKVKNKKTSQLDNSLKYGTMKHNSEEISGKRRSRWEIAPEVKKTFENEPEEDRYYLETI